MVEAAMLPFSPGYGTPCLWFQIPICLASEKTERLSPLPNRLHRAPSELLGKVPIVTLLIRFERFTGKYVFHCHVAEYEDNDLMRPFVVIPFE